MITKQLKIINNEKQHLKTLLKNMKYDMQFIPYVDYHILFNSKYPNYYVSTTGSDTNDGKTVLTPFLTMAKAVETASSGDTILIKAGTYLGDQNCGISIDKNMIICGENGTIFNGEENRRSGFAIAQDKDVDIYNIQFINGYFREAINSSIIGNGSGGAILNLGNGDILNCGFTNNMSRKQDGSYAEGNGGAIYNYNNGNIINCTFTENNEGDNIGIIGYGGAIYNNKSGQIINCIFDSNVAFTDGGAIYNKADGKISYCIFYKNSTLVADVFGAHGGAIYNQNGTITDCSFYYNSVPNNPERAAGGAIYSVGESLIKNCDFLNDNTPQNISNQAITTIDGCYWNTTEPTYDIYGTTDVNVISNKVSANYPDRVAHTSMTISSNNSYVYGTGNTISITLIDNNQQVIPNAPIDFMFNNAVIATVSTDASGVAKTTTLYDVGQYTVEALYHGSKTTSGCQASTTFDVTPGESSLTLTIDKTTAYVNDSITINVSGLGTINVGTTDGGNDIGSIESSGSLNYKTTTSCTIYAQSTGDENRHGAKQSINITVLKKTGTMSLSLSDSSIYVGESTTITVVSQGAILLGTTDGGKDIATIENSGSVDFAPINSCTIYANSSGNTEYEAAKSNTALTVSKQNSTISLSVSSTSINVGESITITASGTGSIYIGTSAGSNNITTFDGSGSISYTPSDSCTIYATSTGNALYNGASKSVGVSVTTPSYPTSLSLSGSTGVTSGYSYSYTINKNNIPSGATIYYYIDDNYQGSTTGSSITCSFAAGSHTLKVVFNGVGYYQASSATLGISCSNPSYGTSLSISGPTSAVAGSSQTYTISKNGMPSNSTIYYYLDGSQLGSTTGNTFSCSFGNGSHTLKVVFNGSGYYQGSSATLGVSGYTPDINTSGSISISNSNPYWGQTIVLTANTNVINRSIQFICSDGQNLSATTNSSGVASVNVSFASPGSVSAYISVNTSGYTGFTSSNVGATVRKRNTSFYNLMPDLAKGSYFTASIWDETRTPIVGVHICISITRNITGATQDFGCSSATNKYGEFSTPTTINYALKDEYLTVNVSFAGDSMYNGSSGSVNVRYNQAGA